MKKKVILAFIPLMLIGCNKGAITKAQSPFNDSYNPIGMTGEYTGNIEYLNSTQFKLLKDSITSLKTDPSEFDAIVKKYTKEERSRDLKYSYFRNELNPTDMCSLVNETSNNTRYSNNVTIASISNERQKQFSGGIDKTITKTDDYTFDTKYKSIASTEHKYRLNTVKKVNEYDAIITKGEEKEYEEDTTIFNLSPYNAILNNHFKNKVIRTKEYKFEMLADNNNAVYGLYNHNGEKRYLIKEAYSVFDPYSTVVGRKYKAVDNYFYEGLLKEVSGGEGLLLTNFRFYHEMLILSEACDEDNNVPVLYLEKPVLVEYNEYKYTFDYAFEESYNGTIPGFNQ